MLTARVVCLEGALTNEEFARVQAYLVNPVESRIASLDKPETLDITADVPADVARVTGFTAMSQEEIAAYWQAMGFAMSAGGSRLLPGLFPRRGEAGSQPD